MSALMVRKVDCLGSVESPPTRARRMAAPFSAGICNRPEMPAGGGWVEGLGFQVLLLKFGIKGDLCQKGPVVLDVSATWFDCVPAKPCCLKGGSATWSMQMCWGQSLPIQPLKRMGDSEP